MAKPHITFQILRHIAESASGMRYHKQWFVVRHDPVTGPVITPYPDAQEETDDTVVIAVDPVDYVEPPPVTYAQIGLGDGRVDLLNVRVARTEQLDPPGLHRADAVFWSVSAVEKFLTPYYASVYGDDGGRMVESLLRVLRPLTEAEVDGDAVAGIDPAFAITHLPNSEYVAMGAPEVMNMFSLHRSGEVHPVHALPRDGYGAGAAQNSGSRAT